MIVGDPGQVSLVLSFSFLLSGVKGWLNGAVVAPQWARLEAVNQLQQRRHVSSLVKLTNNSLHKIDLFRGPNAKRVSLRVSYRVRSGLPDLCLLRGTVSRVPSCPSLPRTKGVPEGCRGRNRLETREKRMNMKNEAQRGEVTYPRAHSSKKRQHWNPGDFLSAKIGKDGQNMSDWSP